MFGEQQGTSLTNKEVYGKGVLAVQATRDAGKRWSRP